MDKSLEKYNLPKCLKKKLESPTSLIIIKEIELIVKNLPREKKFTRNKSFYYLQIIVNSVKKQTTQILYKIFKE